MKKISLRLRVTLVTALVLLLFCGALTLSSIYNVNRLIVSPVLDTYMDPYTGILGDAEEVGEEYSSSEITDTARDQVVMDGRTGFTITSYICMAIAVFLGSVLVYFLSGYALRPISNLSRQIENMTEKELSKEITGFKTNDELETLSDSFNVMRKRLEAAFQREKRFSSDAAHELKTPLTVISANLDVLDMNASPTEEQYVKTLAVVRKQTLRMTSLVADLFAISSADNCKIEDVIDVSILVSEAAQELFSSASEKSIHLAMDIQSCLVPANPVILKHAISNLIENAVKYNNREGCINIQVRQESGQCKIAVIDSGVGIPEDKAQYIFEPFYRVDSSRSRNVGGAGLGLAITKDIVQIHGGTIVYEPGEDGGSQFIIRIPIAK